MKARIQNLQLGEILWAEVHEVLSRHECIVSIEGDLMRVRNESLIELKPYERIRIRVSHLSPLAFQIVGDRHGAGGYLRLNVSI